MFYEGEGQVIGDGFVQCGGKEFFGFVGLAGMFQGGGSGDGVVAVAKLGGFSLGQGIAVLGGE